MKKILIMTILILFIPFIVVISFDIDNKKVIQLKYVYNKIIRVKRNNTGVIEFVPFEEYIVGVLAGEMPIYFESNKTAKVYKDGKSFFIDLDGNVIKK